jgi:hypothetical protein
MKDVVEPSQTRAGTRRNFQRFGDDGDKLAYGARSAQATPDTGSTKSARVYRLQEEASEM